MTQPESRSRRGFQILLGLLISAALIWYAFRDTPFGDVWAQIRAMHLAPMLLAVVVATLPFALRVPRWRLLLRREDDTPLDRRSLWHAIAMGFAANNTLPLRLGELVRMGAITRLGPVPFASAFASVAVERVLDALTAAVLLTAALFMIDLPAQGSLASAATTVGALGLVALVVAAAVARWPALAIRPIETVIPAGRLRQLCLGIVQRLIAGLAALRDPARALPIVGWSIAIWLTNAAGFWLAFRAFDIPVGLAGAIILQGALLVGIALPSSPGYAGAFDLTIMLTLATVFNVPRDVGLAYAIAYHVLTFVPITGLGIASLLRTGLTLRGMREAAR